MKLVFEVLYKVPPFPGDSHMYEKGGKCTPQAATAEPLLPSGPLGIV